MKEHERAAQLWSLLVLAARNQQILSYTTVRHLTGIATSGVGRCLGPIMRYCDHKKLPSLSSIVVNQATGLPGKNFMKWTTEEKLNIFEMQSRVFAYDWFRVHVPSSNELEPFKDPRGVQRGKS
jgi:hypothetical protein